MGNEAHKLINVRDVLEQNSISTTVDQLRSSGRRRVKVVNARQISALIEESVVRVLDAQRGNEQRDVDAIVEESRAEFRKLVAEREQELAELRAEKEAVESQRAALEQEVQEKRRLEETVSRAREDLQRLVGSPDLEDLESLLQSYHQAQASTGHSEEELAELNRSLEARGAAVERERERASELKERVEELKTALQESRDEASRLREDAAASPPAAGGAPPEVIAAILGQLKDLKEGLEARPAGGGAGGEAMESLAEEMAKKLEAFGRKIGLGSAVAEDDVALDAIFDTSTKMESNIDSVKVKQRTGAGIGDALAKMREMQKGGASPQEDD